MPQNQLNQCTMSAEKQERLNALMTKNNAGQLTEPKRNELQMLVREAEEITLANARLLVAQRDSLISSRIKIRQSAK